MKKIFLWLVGLCGWGLAQAQQTYVSRNAQISFYSQAPIEDIEATTQQAVSAINPQTGAVFFKVPITSFTFDSDLMQSHFNSDYLESDKYPYAEFTGQLSPLPTGAGSFPVNVTGKLTIHGVTRDYQTPGVIVVSDTAWLASASFQVKLADHGIKVPTLLMRNIAETVQVRVKAAYRPQQQPAMGPGM